MSETRRTPLQRLRPFFALALGLVLLMPAFAQVPLRVAAAADLQPVLPGLLRMYEKESGNRAEASYASSATLATQIENGAPFDVFLSADMALPEKIVRDGFAAPGAAAAPYARGTLVLWTRNESKLTQLTMQTLASEQVHSIAIANPEHAPYGRAALQALKSQSLLPTVQPKLRTAENIAQAAQFASTGNADVGLISLTSALTLAAQGHFILVPRAAYPPILQGGVALKGGASTHSQDSTLFLKFLHTPAAIAELRRGGLEPVQ